MVLPGETALLVAGVFCNAKYGHLNLGVMMVVAAVAAIAGDSVGYEFGRKFGPALRRSRRRPVGRRAALGRGRRVHPPPRRQGGAARPADRAAAGADAVDGRDERHALPDVPDLERRSAASIWAPGCVLLGYAFAHALSVVGETLTWAPLAVLALLIIGYGVLHLRRRKQEQAEELEYERTHPESGDVEGALDQSA